VAASTNSPRAVAFLILVLAPCLSPWSAAHHKGYRRAGGCAAMWTLAFGHVAIAAFAKNWRRE